MNFRDFQSDADSLYRIKEWTRKPEILGLGLCGEAGEVAAAILDQSPDFVKKEGRRVSQVENELVDLLIYAAIIAVTFNIDLGFAVEREMKRKLQEILP